MINYLMSSLSNIIYNLLRFNNLKAYGPPYIASILEELLSRKVTLQQVMPEE
ncbi:hypothetical protein HMPREF1982_02141 [Clostridiales bacterium oral taxon 876 str. F0540]|nr:hypothetical protein HMPREF1982_02141 [Clostridiales bacterium oral taxon 876 str. F0540]